MAKEAAQKVKKGKTPAQLAKKEENERKAAERLAKLQTRQKLARELRAQGFVGTDDQIIDKYEGKTQQAKALSDEEQHAIYAEKKKAEAAAKEEKHRLFLAAQQASKMKYVEEALAGPSGVQLLAWLGDKPATFQRVEQFLQKTGLPRTAGEIKVEVGNAKGAI
jgi:hypothetical protein